MPSTCAPFRPKATFTPARWSVRTTSPLPVTIAIRCSASLVHAKNFDKVAVSERRTESRSDAPAQRLWSRRGGDRNFGVVLVDPAVRLESVCLRVRQVTRLLLRAVRKVVYLRPAVRDLLQACCAGST